MSNTSAVEPNTQSPTRQSVGHLAYYIEHGLNPVHYDLSDLDGHLERRGSLYRALGLVPFVFRNARVLEVAPGTGQNSLYVARLEPREYTLVEPNPTGIQDIRRLYETPGISPITPRLFQKKFEDFNIDESFDVVLCENWLGHQLSERELLKKLGGYVAPGGFVAVTFHSPTGLLSNLLRKALTTRIDDPTASFEQRTQRLTEAFTGHLATIQGMTRTHEDWIHDNVMNPHYFAICLKLSMVLEDLGDRFDVLGSSPDLATDWRWFKSLHGEARDFNGHFENEYLANCHSLFDHRRTLPRRPVAANRALETIAWDIHEAAAEFELSTQRGQADAAAHGAAVLDGVRRVIENLSDQPADLLDPLHEFVEVFEKPAITGADVAGMTAFSGLFGRETLYAGLERRMV